MIIMKILFLSSNYGQPYFELVHCNGMALWLCSLVLCIFYAVWLTIYYSLCDIMLTWCVQVLMSMCSISFCSRPRVAWSLDDHWTMCDCSGIGMCLLVLGRPHAGGVSTLVAVVGSFAEGRLSSRQPSHSFMGGSVMSRRGMEFLW